MEIYYIYHIKGKKIGCTNNLKLRVENNQKSTDYEVLEQHTDIMVASSREIELQKQYGYKVDNIPYYKSYQFAQLQVANQYKIDRKQARIKGAANTDYKTTRIKGALKHSKPIIQYDKQMNKIQEWKSARFAADTLGLHQAGINNCCLGKAKSAGGFIWKYN